MGTLELISCGFAGQTGLHHPAIHLDNAWARRTPPMAQQEQGGHGGSALSPDNSAVYITLSNHGSEPDALVSAATNIATTAELDETIAKDGKMVMQPRPQFDIPAGETLEMKPGDSVNVVLTFQKAGQMSVEAPVK
jgi:copper(I)-binding protein